MNLKYIGDRKDYWYIRIQISANRSETLHKAFYFKKYGGKQKALMAAIKFRDEYLRKRGELYRLKNERSGNIFRITKSNAACIGVRRLDEGTFHGWMVNIARDKKKRFSEANYGVKGSFLCACEVRYETHGTIIILDKKQIPCLPTVPYKYLKT